ncbi:MAG: S1/P1 nuclease [Phycisphaerae bacterium]
MIGQSRCFGMSLVLAVAMSSFAAPSFGWGNEGHLIVGEIAWQQLTSEAKAGVLAILKTDENKKYHRLSHATLWADDIKNRKHPENDKYGWARPLHYVNLPKDKKTYQITRDCRLKSDCPSNIVCPSRNCVVEAINFYAEVLRTNSRTPEEKLIALKFLAHFVGDLHQPLHAGLAEDRGGNDIKVKFYGKQRNLHAVWDSSIIERHIELNRWGGAGWRTYAQSLQDLLKPSDRRMWLQATKPSQWAEESSKLAKRFAYHHAHQDKPIVDGTELDDSYFRLGLMIIDGSLQRGGLRFGALLNDIFKKKEEK